jgi:hypothetical protein
METCSKAYFYSGWLDGSVIDSQQSNNGAQRVSERITEETNSVYRVIFVYSVRIR